MTVYLQDPDVTLLHGDVLEQLATLPDESVHCVVTSPPYWGLRDYGTGSWVGGNPDCDHTPPKQPERKFRNSRGEGIDDKYAGSNLKSWTDRDGSTYRDVCGKCGARRTDHQLGLEPTPDHYIARMVEVFREVRRVLRRDGTCWLNIGDSYANDGKWGGSTGGKHVADLHGAAGGLGRDKRFTGLKPKDLVGIPWRLAFALQADGWWLRSAITWVKPNCMPESVTDRPTKATEMVFLLTRSARYYYDAEAVREPHAHDGRQATRVVGQNGSLQHRDGERWPGSGRNQRDWWLIPTQPYPEAHFATFPEELARRCILAGTSERGCCPVCGAPWVREVVATGADNNRVREDVGDWIKHKGGNADGKRSLSGATYKRQRAATHEWRPSCNCEGEHPCLYPLENVACVVMDPFVGSGTVPHVARKHGRHSIGIDLNAEYLRLTAKRLGDPDAEQEIALAKETDAQLNLLARLDFTEASA